MVLLIGNLTNVVVHRVLEKSVKEEILRNHYDKESLVSLEVAKRYRDQINPIERALPDIDVKEIEEGIMKRARSELQLRISRGYQRIQLDTIKAILKQVLQELKIK